MSYSLAELAVRFGCSVGGDPDVRLERVATLANAGCGDISFLANPRYRSCLAGTRASAVILGERDLEACPVPALVAEDPYATYARVATLLHPARPVEPGIHERAAVAQDASVADSACVGPGAVIESGAGVGARVVVGPGCVVGRNATLGDDTRLVANVTICEDVRIGPRTIVHPGAVIGADGFGLAREPEGWVKVPQLGSVTVGADVEIGASTTVDRGSIDDTVIGDGVKLDNQIQIGHNVRIGAHTVIAACSGVSGSTVIGKRCMIAGAVGFVGHLDIADDVVITGQTMVSRSISEPGGVYSSALPMDEARRWRRNSARFRHLDELAERVKLLEITLKARDREQNGDD